MYQQLLKVLGVVRPKHIFRAFISPLHTIKVLKYHYRRVSEREFVHFLARSQGYSAGAVEQACKDFHSHQLLWDEVEKKLTLYPNSYGLQMTRERPALYVLTRLLKPNIMVETGVSSGATSTYILRAMQDNGCGRLFSIDLPPDNLPQGHTSGWIVPESLRSQWVLKIGDSKELLGPLLHELCAIDCFLHDSLHTDEHMLWEFRTAWKHLRRGGLFLSHDVGASEAFFDFMAEQHIPWSSYRVFHVLGGFTRA